MAHGKIRVNTLTYDTGSGDVDVAVSAIATGTVPGNTEIDARITAATGVSVQGFDTATAKTDEVQRFTKPQRGDIVEYTGTSFTIDFATSNNFLLKPSGNYTIALSNLANTHGQTGSIFIEPTAAATITGSWPTVMLFVGGDAGITLTGTSGGIDRIDYIVLDDTSGSEKITCNVTTNYVT
tara:strand:- start:127 stop:669 length:543 start_codon:yes stop_codon:yes gene_type:complete